MTTTFLLPDLEIDEGWRAVAYQDEFGNWTIGYGHTGREVHEGLVWDRVIGYAALMKDVAATKQGLSTAAEWWLGIDGLFRQDVMVNLAFNLGVHGLVTKWPFFCNFMQEGKYHLAAGEILSNKVWCSQVGARATRLAAQLESNTHGGT